LFCNRLLQLGGSRVRKTEAGVAIVDIGGGTTDLAVFYEAV
jgi:actin-like ATPase involved in cell morphogenesis